MASREQTLQMLLDLKSRELDCIYSLTALVEHPDCTIDSICEGLVNLLPQSWIVPGDVCAAIYLNDKWYRSAHYRVTGMTQTATITIGEKESGQISVEYVRLPDTGNIKFLMTEHFRLLETLAERIGKIVARKQAEDMIGLTDNIFRSSVSGIILYDLEGRLLRINPAGVKIFGFKSQYEMVKMSIKEILGSKYEEVASSLCTSGMWQGEFEAKNRDNEWFTLYGMAASVKNRDGQIRYYTASFFNISDRVTLENSISEKNEELARQYKELEAKNTILAAKQEELENKTVLLEQANHSKAEFLATMSHELRTPLNAIIGFSELMLDGILGDVNDEQKQALQDIYAGGHRLLSLIDDVLNLSRIQTGKTEFRMEPVIVQEIIDSNMEHWVSRLGENNQRLSVTISPRINRVRADKARLQQAITHLIVNAGKFSPEGSLVSVEIKPDGEWCQISVQDEGIGIKPENINLVFDAFTQIETLPDKEREGTGLGLALTRQFVEAWGGRIWAQSTYGKGSCFTFTVPLCLENR